MDDTVFIPTGGLIVSGVASYWKEGIQGKIEFSSAEKELKYE